MRSDRLAFLAAIVVSVMGSLFGACGTPVELTPEHRNAIESGLRQARLPAASSIEVSGSFIVATFVVDDAALSQMSAAGITSPKEFASKAVLTVRNAMLPFKVTDSYRVTLNGPPPGPGLILRYGTARFIEGGAVSWEPGPPK